MDPILFEQKRKIAQERFFYDNNLIIKQDNSPRGKQPQMGMDFSTPPKI